MLSITLSLVSSLNRKLLPRSIRVVHAENIHWDEIITKNPYC